jgi:DNA-binding MarR family transcriptional regulator
MSVVYHELSDGVHLSVSPALSGRAVGWQGIAGMGGAVAGMAKKDKGSGKRKASEEDSSGQIAARLSNVARTARTRLTQHLGEHGLYAGQDAVIMELALRDGLSPGEIADALGVRAPTITKTINRLAAQGFVEKRGSTADGRRARIHLTAQGLNTVAAIKGALRNTERAMLDGLTGKEAKTLSKLLKRLDQNLRQAEIGVGTAR